MSQLEYEHECSRAELLGVSPPTWDEFVEQRKTLASQDCAEESLQNEGDAELTNEIQEQGENIKKANGGLEELNTILASTQLKINKFKSVCGSFTNLMKIKTWKTGEAQESGEASASSVPATPCKTNSGNPSTKGDIENEVADQIDRLDSLLGKAERAEISMSSQNKQMKSYLRK